MMKSHASATKWVWLWLLLAVAHPVWAAGEVAVVMSLTGTVKAQGHDGKTHLLATNAALVPGEVVSTGPGSSATLRFGDGSMITLRAVSRFVIESYTYVVAKPQSDRLVFNLLKGGMRAVSGAIGHRGNKDAYQARTSAGTIGIRGTDYAVLLCMSGNCQSLAIPPDFKSNHGKLPDGLYLTVFKGAINLSNDAGSKDYTAGNSAYVHDSKALSEKLSADPGLAHEIPPPDKTSGTTPAPGEEKVATVELADGSESGKRTEVSYERQEDPSADSPSEEPVASHKKDADTPKKNDTKDAKPSDAGPRFEFIKNVDSGTFSMGLDTPLFFAGGAGSQSAISFIGPTGGGTTVGGAASGGPGPNSGAGAPSSGASALSSGTGTSGFAATPSGSSGASTPQAGASAPAASQSTPASQQSSSPLPDVVAQDYVSPTTSSDSFNSIALAPITSNAAPVPEPETWALFLAGLGLVAWAIGRRR